MEQDSLQIHSKMSKTQVIAYGFLTIIIIGTCLLKLPFATNSGKSCDWLTALFTATSSTCVTGLVVVDTYTYWSRFGQIVILLLIQIGGLGFMSIGISLLMFFRQKVGLNQRGLMQESISANELGGMVKLVKIIIAGTAIVEATGAILLMFRFVPLVGFWEGVFYSVFHSISAFCNAGFDLMGRFEPYSSLSMFYNDAYINIIMILLITIGGIGFMVWQDVLSKKKNYKKYRLHTKIVLSMTAAIFVVTTLLFLFFEWNQSMEGMTFKERLLSSMFSTVTARTAGFNTIDTASLSDAGKFLTVILMFIGGSPGSTAGGIKTTTILVIGLYLWSNIRNSSGVNIFGRRLDDEVIKRASLAFFINIMLAISAILIICSMESLNFIDIMFEVFSAIGTAGMSTGITRDICVASKLILVLLMYCGRIGSMTFAMSFVERKFKNPIKLPVEKIIVG